MSRPVGNFRWLVVALLLLATTINYLDRQVLGLLKPVLEQQFKWTQSDFAAMVTAFTAAYAIGLMVAGRIIDRLGTRLGFSLMVIFWSLAGMAHALSQSVRGFMAARFALGVGEAGNFPASAKAVAEWFPHRERGLATGIFNAGPSLGVVVSVLTVPLVLQAYGWQAVFWVTGGLGFLWLLLWWWLYDLPRRHRMLGEEERRYILSAQAEEQMQSQESIQVSWWRLFRLPQTWALVAGKAFIDPIFWFFLFWLPSYFADVFKLDMTKPSIPLMVIYLSATVGSIGGGWISSALIRKGWPVVKARKTALLFFAVVEISVIFTQFAGELWMVVALISLAVAVHQAWATNVFTLASDLFPREVVGSVTGIAGTAGSVGGMLFPILIGYLLDRWQAAGDIEVGYNLLFTGCGMAYLITWVIIHLLTRRAGRVDMHLKLI